MVRVFRARCLQRENKVFGAQNPLEMYKKFGAGRFRMVSAGKTECYGRGKTDMEEDFQSACSWGKPVAAQRNLVIFLARWLRL